MSRLRTKLQNAILLDEAIIHRSTNRCMMKEFEESNGRSKSLIVGYSTPSQQIRIYKIEPFLYELKNTTTI